MTTTRIRFTLSLGIETVLDATATPIFDRDEDDCALIGLTVYADDFQAEWHVRMIRLLPAGCWDGDDVGAALTLMAGCPASWRLRARRADDGLRIVELLDGDAWIDLREVSLRDLLTDQQVAAIEELATW